MTHALRKAGELGPFFSSETASQDPKDQSLVVPPKDILGKIENRFSPEDPEAKHGPLLKRRSSK